MDLNTDLVPLVKLSTEVLDEATKILNQISDLLKLVQLEHTKPPSEMDFTKVQGYYDEMADLSNTFYELLPHKNFSHTSIPPINDSEIVASKMEMITNLTDVCIARKLLIAATFKLKDINPLDYCFKALNIKLDLLDEESGEFKTLLGYAKNTSQSSPFKIKNIYRLQRKGEAERIQQWKDLDNHFLLWHGSRTSNFIGILSEGLRIAPPSAPVSGYAFGKGVYFADMFSKSYGYCRSSSDEPAFFIAL